MSRCLMILIAVIWAAATGAFFMYVPILPVLGTACVIFGFVLMFIAGVHVGIARTASTDTLGAEILSAPGTNCGQTELPQNANH